MNNKRKTIISGIYMIKNNVNGKIYIGSAIDIHERWSLHKTSLRANRSMKKLQEDWNIYDEDCFEMIILEVTINDEKILTTTEQKYLDKFKPYEGDVGYNKNPKAIRTVERPNRPIYQYDMEGVFIKEWKSISEAARNVIIKPSGIYQSCKSNKISAAGFIWRFKNDLNNTDNLNPDEFIDSHWTPVLQYDLYGNFMKEWKNITVASTYTNTNDCSITNVCAGRAKTGGNFIWRYKKDDIKTDKIDTVKDLRSREVLQFDLNNNFLKEWNNTTIAGKSLKINRKYIAAICNGTNKRKSKKFLWKWKK